MAQSLAHTAVPPQAEQDQRGGSLSEPDLDLDPSLPWAPYNPTPIAIIGNTDTNLARFGILHRTYEVTGGVPAPVPCVNNHNLRSFLGGGSRCSALPT